MPITLITLLKMTVALGLLNVWLLRFNKPTAYRGGNAQNMLEEFTEYGLPTWLCYAIGFLKCCIAFALWGSLVVPEMGFPAAALLISLMLAAISMHLKVGDPLKKYLPALTMLAMSLIICLSYVPHY